MTGHHGGVIRSWWCCLAPNTLFGFVVQANGLSLPNLPGNLESSRFKTSYLTLTTVECLLAGNISVAIIICQAEEIALESHEFIDTEVEASFSVKNCNA
ncbi:hypothetical protein CPB83DRAFT_117527 [Crepidotus variabilis]|uniref:Uncharacterized protein n=1 Tax=Crepidotus variabilis TaxID=179855 RepID=A0A9P6E4A2_9AGAR|nr:hypothetical protein CPB83DRAFT_117527 [Crepidotus variabilis]